MLSMIPKAANLAPQDFTAVEVDPDVVDLRKEGILLTEYYGLTHPSQPNYVASVGGDYFGLNSDSFVRVPQNVSTLVDLLDGAGIAWKGYFEGIPGPGYMAEGSTASDGTGWDYVRKHKSVTGSRERCEIWEDEVLICCSPFISYDSINMNGTRLAQLQGFGEFANDVSANTLPQYAHMSPDMLNDGHNTTLAYATNWTRSFLTPLLANEQFMNKTLILLTYDESATYSQPNRIGSLLLGGAVPDSLKGTNDSTLYTHYSILSTLENNWNLPNLGRYDVGANVFQLVANQTGYANHPPGDLAYVNNSLSYSGFLNSDASKYLPIPAPNLQLTGAGGKGVDATVASAWASASGEDTPYNGSGDTYDGGNGTSAPNAPVYKAQGTNANSTGTATTTTSAPAAETNQKSGAGRETVGWAGVMVGIVAFAAFIFL